VARRALTGALLVGGASERFGSPKALARLRGETLLERGVRLLGEACDEVLVVGKAADAWAGGLRVVDDGSPGRAPAHGVLAALRAARHDTCVVLPVDCPLLTPAAIRELGETVSTSPTGPLPGAYARDAVDLLAERIARGELSLRGVNPAASTLPEALFVDVDTPEELARLERPGHVLVVGGTGMLRPLVAQLAGRGHPVSVVSRRGGAMGEGVTALAVDYRDGAALESSLARAVDERGAFELAVCWIHTDAPDAPTVVARHVRPGGRLTQVFGTAVWPLERPPVRVALRQVLLGSRGGRWLTDVEISDGVLAAVDADVPVHVVGERR
jgi:molybdopterin-guanine dinucleotide biosynthesis protein A